MINDLIERLAAEEGSEDLDMAITDHLGLGIPATTVRYSRSLEAALTLIEKGVGWAVIFDPSCSKPYTAELNCHPNPIEVDGATAALSVCIGWACALKAHKAVK